MGKISLQAELTSGNIADDDLYTCVDVSGSVTLKVKHSSLYAYIITKLDAVSPPRLLPSSAGSSGEYLQYNGTWSTPTNTTYSVMNSGNSYAAGLVAAGSATHGGEYLRKDGTWDEVLELTTPLTTFRPQLVITKDGTSDGTFTFGSTNYVDITIAKHNHSASSYYYWVNFSVQPTVTLTGHTTGTTSFQLTFDLSAWTIDGSAATVSPPYFTAVVQYNQAHFPVLGRLVGNTVELNFIGIGLTADGSFATEIAGSFQLYIN